MLLPAQRSRGVTAVLGPTNTGKTHYAIERMLGHSSGLIGLPLRLLAREVYGRVVERAGTGAVALVTGEEKIIPKTARYWIATVEAMPRDLDTAFVALDEIQLSADRDRGHVFTDRLLNMRGREETLLIGSATMRPLVEKLMPGVHVVSRPRLSQLTFSGDKKITRLPRRTAIVAFSAEEVYAVAELIRRQRGGAAVVLGALSPRTRNAQVELYQNGDVEYLVATDAIGMGLNLDVDHVAFAADRKFDGRRQRNLSPSEIAQIAGRAGRHLRDGTFGTTGRCDPFDDELIGALENHVFEPMRLLQWRNADLDTGTIPRLLASLDAAPREPELIKAEPADDFMSLDILSRQEEMRRYASSREAVERLWGLCRLPDYRKSAPSAHADLVGHLYRQIMTKGRVSTDWFSLRVAEVDRTEGDIATLSARIAQVRTWTFVANRPDWLGDPEHWQGVTRRVEDSLSDALHERLTQRFVDRRTSVLMRRLRENAMLEAEITAAGDVLVEGHHVGRLAGFQFAPDPEAGGSEAKALKAASSKALAAEFDARANRVGNAVDEAFVLGNDGAIRWLGEVVGKIAAGEKLLEPRVRLLADEQLTGAARDKVQERLDGWLKAHVTKLLGPLQGLESSETLQGIARGIGFQIAEALGVLERTKVADDVKGLDQTARSALRTLGVRFGAYHLTMPALLKPAPRGLACRLWALQNGGEEVTGIDDIMHLAASGRTSIPVDKDIPKALYRAAGFRVCGDRAVRVDILERLADLIRPAIQYRPGTTPGEPPAGTADGEGFVVTTAMTSLCGCAGEDFAGILRSLGYVSDKRPGPAVTVALAPVAKTEPAVPTPATETVSEAATDAVPAETMTEPASEPVAETAPETVEAEAVAPTEIETTDVEPAETEAPAAEAIAASDDASPAVEAGTEEASAEPVLIEVWKQHRHHGRPQNRGDRRPGGGRPGQGRRPEGEAAAPRAEGEAAAPRRFDRPQRRDGKPGERPQGERPQGVRPQGERPQGDRPQGERPQGDRPQGARGERSGGRPDQRRDDRRGGPGGGPRRDRGGDDRAPRAWQDEPRAGGRDKAPDPNSPFAKLLALKADLETKGRK